MGRLGVDVIEDTKMNRILFTCYSVQYLLFMLFYISSHEA